MAVLQEIEEFYKELGERIKTERLRRKISQEDLGNRLGLTRASVVNLEKGRHRPSVYQVIQIANFFSLDYTRLIPYEFEKNETVATSEIDLNKAIIDPEVDQTTREGLLTHIVSKMDSD